MVNCTGKVKLLFISCYAFRFTVETREEGRGKREKGRVLGFVS
jgi:hypothetical protein